VLFQRGVALMLHPFLLHIC
jgi:hypothetical protein